MTMSDAAEAAPPQNAKQDAALRQLLASMRCRQYRKARFACTSALAAGAEPALMRDYAAVRAGVRRRPARAHAPPRRPSTPSSRSAAGARTTPPRRRATRAGAAASSSSWPSCCSPSTRAVPTASGRRAPRIHQPSRGPDVDGLAGRAGARACCPSSPSPTRSSTPPRRSPRATRTSRARTSRARSRRARPVVRSA